MHALNLRRLHASAFWQGFAIGAVCCRIEPTENHGCNKLYIMTLAVLAPYRRRGIGVNLLLSICRCLRTMHFISIFLNDTARQMLEYVLKQANEDKTIEEVYLHVQIRYRFVHAISNVSVFIFTSSSFQQ